MKIPKTDRKNIKSIKLTMKKSKIFPREKMHHLAKETEKSMKKHHSMKHSKEDLHAAHKHMHEHMR